jgi:hypothetical protein
LLALSAPNAESYLSNPPPTRDAKDTK